MTRSRAVSALVLAVSCVLAASSAGAASDAFKTTVRFSKAVQLTDGSVLQANVPYEFQINFAGTGNTAEFEFMVPGRNVKQPAEAVGFSSAASAEGGTQVRKGWDIQKSVATRIRWDYYALEQKGATNEWVKVPSVKAEDDYKYKIFEGDSSELRAGKHIGKAILHHYVKIKMAGVAPSAPVESWSFGAAGFGPNTHPKATEEGGLIIVVVPSSNSPAFFKSQFRLSPGKPAPMKKPRESKA